jgi:hypothetical protein
MKPLKKRNLFVILILIEIILIINMNNYLKKYETKIVDNSIHDESARNEEDINHLCNYTFIDTFNENSMIYYNLSLKEAESQIKGCRHTDTPTIYTVTDLIKGSTIYKDMIKDESLKENIDYHKITLNLTNLFKLKDGKYHSICPNCSIPDNISSILCWTQRLDKKINVKENWGQIKETFKKFKFKNELFEVIVNRFGFYYVECNHKDLTYYNTMINILPLNMTILREETIHQRNYVDEIKRKYLNHLLLI